MTDIPTATVANAWTDHVLWSDTASRLKRRVQLGHRYAAALGFIGAALATASTVGADSQAGGLSAHRTAAIVSAVLLAVVPLILLRISPRERIVAWLRSRSASEGLKEEVYRFLAGGPPYAKGRDTSLLAKRCARLTEAVRDLARYKAEAAPAPQAPPPVRGIDDYVEQRVDHQIKNYYRAQALTLARRASIFEWLEIAAAVAAAALGALGAFAGPASGIQTWVAVATTAVSAVAAHQAWERYSALAVIYQATADRLAELKAAFLDDAERGTPERAARFIDDCERAISSQNESWLAAWSRDPDTR